MTKITKKTTQFNSTPVLDENNEKPTDEVKNESTPVDEVSLENEDSKNGQQTDFLKYIMDTGIELFKDQMGQAHARVKLDEGNRILEVESDNFTGWLEKQLYKHLKHAPPKNQVEALQRDLAFKARFERPEYPLAVRVARYKDSIWVDINGSQAVKVNPGSWEIVDDPPILFRSFPHQKPLPVPVKGGDPCDILRFVNLKNEDQKRLYMCFLVTALIPDIPIAILVLNGSPGSAKSTLLKFTKLLLDPSKPVFQGKLRNMKDFAQIASQHRMLAFDNLSKLGDEQSDILCGAITGDGDCKRKAYTDHATTSFEYRNIVGLTGVHLLPERSDLLDRSLILTLDRIDETDVKYEEELTQEFEKALPSIFGGILDTLAEVLVIKETISIDEKPRLADFAKYGASAAEALGWGKDAFLDVFKSNIALQNDSIIEADPFTQTVIKFMEEHDEWDSTATDLLVKLNKIASALELDTKASNWPKSSNKIATALRYSEQALLSEGISWHKGKGADRKKYFLEKADISSVVGPDPANAHGEQMSIDTPEPSSIVGSVDSDDDDDTLSLNNGKEIVKKIKASQNESWAEICLEYWLEKECMVNPST